MLPQKLSAATTASFPSRVVAAVAPVLQAAASIVSDGRDARSAGATTTTHPSEC